MNNKYDWGIYNGLGGDYDFRDKDRNININNSYMLVKSLKMFKYENMPDSINVVEMEKILQTKGYVVIVKHEGELLALEGSVGGVGDMYNKPTEVLINNPYLKLNKQYRIGEDCVVITNDYLSIGLLPLYNKYNRMIVENELTMVLSNYNKRVENIISASDDNVANSARIYLKNIEDGKIGYIMDNMLYENLKTHSTNSNASVRMMDLIEYQQYLKSNLYNEIGLNSIHNMKKERMVVDEVNADADSIYTLVDSMLECRKQGLEDLSELFEVEKPIVTFSGTWGNRYELLNENIEDEILDLNLVDGKNVDDGVDDVKDDVLDDVKDDVKDDVVDDEKGDVVDDEKDDVLDDEEDDVVDDEEEV